MHFSYYRKTDGFFSERSRDVSPVRQQDYLLYIHRLCDKQKAAPKTYEDNSKRFALNRSFSLRTMQANHKVHSAEH